MKPQTLILIAVVVGLAFVGCGVTTSYRSIDPSYSYTQPTKRNVQHCAVYYEPQEVPFAYKAIGELSIKPRADRPSSRRDIVDTITRFGLDNGIEAFILPIDPNMTEIKKPLTATAIVRTE